MLNNSMNGACPNPPLAKERPFFKAGLFLLLPLFSASAWADLRTDLTGYYSFESETAGTVPNAARALTLPGFANDGARLFGGEAAAASVPLSSQPGAALAGAAALACDGDGDYANLTVAPVSTETDFSVSVWFKPQTGGAGLTGAVRAFVFESEPAYAISYGLRAGSAGRTNLQLFADLATLPDVSQNYEIPNAGVDQWHHLVLTCNVETGVVTGYLDGAARYQFTLAGPLSPIAGFHTGTFRSANGRYFKGFMDEQVFWQRTLTPGEATALYTGGTAAESFVAISAREGNQALRTGLTAYYPYDGHSDRVVANAAVALGAPGYAGDGAELKGDFIAPGIILPPLTNDPGLARAGNRALLCDGINNYAGINGNPVDRALSWTVSAWFRPDTGGLGYGTAATRAFIFESGATWSISFGLLGAANPQETTYQMYSLLNTGTSLAVSLDRPNTGLDQWHHFAQTYNAATGAIIGYLDGVAALSLSTVVGATRVPLQTYSGFRLGTYRDADGRWFKGLIDEVGMWQRPLDAGEVQLVYALGNAGLAIPAAGAGLGSTGFTAVPGHAGAHEISWSTTAGLHYAIEASGDLTDWSTTLAEEIPATGPSLTFRIVPAFPAPAGALYDPGAADSGQRFYRVRYSF